MHKGYFAAFGWKSLPDNNPEGQVWSPKSFVRVPLINFLGWLGDGRRLLQPFGRDKDRNYHQGES
jgi:hypothetical protein